MPAARGVKRTASKQSSTASGPSKSKKKRNVIQLEVPKLQRRRGRVLTCGQGDVGQLGLGEDVVETSRFKHVTGLSDKIVEVCAGGMHTIALDSDGKVWTFGCNDEGALGRPTSGETEEGTPGEVKLPRGAVMISAGDSHSAALLDNGDVYAWGAFRDSHGSMGLVVQGRENKSCKSPVKLALPETAHSIASGGDHLVILTTSGAVYTMGCGEQGQLGRLAQRSASRETRQGFLALLTPNKVTLKSGAISVWAGYHATFALHPDADKVYAWGLNNYGQLGITGEKRKTALFAPLECDAFAAAFAAAGGPWRRVAPGQHHSLALDAAGHVYAVGRCDYGRLGLGDRQGDAEHLEPVPALADKKCVSIAAGTSNSFAVTDTGEVLAWGMGSEGQLGTGGSADAAEPTLATAKSLENRKPVCVSAGGQHTVLLVEDPSAQRSPSPAPPMETEEQKVEDAEEPPEPAKVEKPKTKGRPTKRTRQDKAEDQEDEVSSTSTAHPATTGTKKLNGSGKKETPMEVEDNEKSQEPKKDEKPDQKAEDVEMKDVSDGDKPDTDASSQDTVASDGKSPDSAPKSVDSVPKSVDSAPKSVDSGPKSVDSAPKSVDSAPKSVDSTASTTKTEETTPQPTDSTAKDSTESKKSESESKSIDSISKSVDSDNKMDVEMKDKEKVEVNGTPETEVQIEKKTVDSIQSEAVKA